MEWGGGAVLKVVLELDSNGMKSGYVTATKIDDKGQRKGKLSLDGVVDLLGEVFNWDALNRQVRLVSKFADTPYLAWGQNGAKWVAVQEIPPAQYFLVPATGQAYAVRLPRLVVAVSNYAAPRIYWAKAGPLELKTKIYPLMIGNIDPMGRACLGSTGLKCERPEHIGRFVRQVIEAPSNGHYLPDTIRLDKFYQALTKRWSPGIGRPYGIPLERLLQDVY